ncbi:branched-chain amino acid transport system II carrier protein [Deinococcus proteolyticus MRP]|uniref:Branched-chain amino acid transport system II carrier protein n=1 Tax=Deinococcus proteolyticus (strain ATCC 35074 / DSM 20540 / JCM 6276 / NBRC 101906 / NCIMB 13154 / VKM Ac-1939 / CCM 2703 / MRP) TaxID=693977 RepID=F0RM69_DEIPM|nr:branched-chain amino acid transport system II carrier protein [Deinococcus proteolyticus]ADY25989.1 branched-chain amino acid transport system II carrier protein [Deinococcus proteolyticus MRP]
MFRTSLTVGFMLFAIFFGAGNLIFPPQLGAESGAAYAPAMLGFLLTGVGLPLLGIVVGALAPGGYADALRRIHPAFSLVFLTAIYLAIGPLFAIPRTGATAYQMALVPFLGSAGGLSLLLWTLGYFGLALWLSLNPSRMVDRIGEWLTPALLLSLLALIVRAFMLLSGQAPAAPAAAYAGGQAFFAGFTAGYQTLDALAAVAFSVVVLGAIQSKGVASGPALLRQTATAGVIAAFFLGLVYLALGWTGAHMLPSSDTLAALQASGTYLGTYLLTTIANDAFGPFGRTLLGVIVTLACLTTTVGLLVAVGEYLVATFPRLKYRPTVIGLTLFSLLIANQGLNAIISVSVPALVILYPITICVILLMLLARFVPTPRLGWQLAVAAVTGISLLSSAHSNGWLALPWVEALPLRAQSLEWLPFMLGGLALGWGLGGRGERISLAAAAAEHSHGVAGRTTGGPA